MADSPNRIPAELAEAIRRWRFPDVGDASAVPSAEKERKDREPRPGESVEEAEPPAKPLTADEVAAITEAARQEGYQQGREEGRAAGHAEGFEQGHAEGLAKARDTIQAQAERLDQVLEQLLAPLREQDDALEHKLVAVVDTLTRAVVGRELTIDRGQLLELVRQALNALPSGAGNIRVYVHPDDVALLREHSAGKDWSLHEDAELAPGGCRVQTRESLVDFSVAERLDAVLAQFARGELAGGDEPTTVADVTPDHEIADQPNADQQYADQERADQERAEQKHGSHEPTTPTDHGGEGQ